MAASVPGVVTVVSHNSHLRKPLIRKSIQPICQPKVENVELSLKSSTQNIPIRINDKGNIASACHQSYWKCQSQEDGKIWVWLSE
jgi:hypothetical protein